MNARDLTIAVLAAISLWAIGFSAAITVLAVDWSRLNVG